MRTTHPHHPTSLSSASQKSGASTNGSGAGSGTGDDILNRRKFMEVALENQRAAAAAAAATTSRGRSAL